MIEIEEFGLHRLIWGPEYHVTEISYAWIGYGPYEVYVADIKDGYDETAIMNQIDAEMLGWA